MNVLFITFTNIGDVVLSSVLLDRIIQTYPDCVVDVVAGGKSTELFDGLPNIGETIPLIKKKHHGHYIELWKMLRNRKYDIIVDLRTPLLTKFLNAEHKITYKPNKTKHKAVQIAELWPSDAPLQTKVWLKDEVHNKINDFITNHYPKIISGQNPLIAIAPTANWVGKCWPQKHFAQLIGELSKTNKFKNASFAIFGAEHERKSVADLLNFIPVERCINLVGKTSITEAGAWISRADLFIGNDSGLAHMAAAAKVPMVTLFGPTPDHIYAPVSTKGKLVIAPFSETVNLEDEAKKRLITDISPEMVMQEINTLINTAQPEAKAC